MIYQDNIKMHEYHGPMKWKIDQLFQKDKESCGENFQNDSKKHGVLSIMTNKKMGSCNFGGFGTCVLKLKKLQIALKLWEKTTSPSWWFQSSWTEIFSSAWTISRKMCVCVCKFRKTPLKLLYTYLVLPAKSLQQWIAGLHPHQSVLAPNEASVSSCGDRSRNPNRVACPTYLSRSSFPSFSVVGSRGFSGLKHPKMTGILDTFKLRWVRWVRLPWCFVLVADFFWNWGFPPFLWGGEGKKLTKQLMN